MKYKLFSTFIVTFLVFSFTILPDKGVADSTPTANDEGFIIEADRVEGVLSLPRIVTGETSKSPKKLMLRLGFIHATIYGLTLTKVTNTPEGPITIQIKSEGPVELTNMEVDVTKIEFGGIYIPGKLGELGMKNVRLVAHKQTANDAILPNLSVSFVQKGAIDTTPDSEKKLREISGKLGELIEGNNEEKKKTLSLPLTLEELLTGKKKDEKKDKQKDEEKNSDDDSGQTTETDEPTSNPSTDEPTKDEDSTEPGDPNKDEDCKVDHPPSENQGDKKSDDSSQEDDSSLTDKCQPSSEDPGNSNTSSSESNDSQTEVLNKSSSQETDKTNNKSVTSNNSSFNQSESTDNQLKSSNKSNSNKGEERKGLLDLLLGILP